MIEKEKRKQIVKLIKDGCSEAEICRNCGVSRNTVRRVKNAISAVSPKKLVMKSLAKIITLALRNKTEKGICPICNKTVSLPCPYCLIKHYNQLCKRPVQYEEYTESDVPFPAEGSQRIGSEAYNTLELRPEEQKRYTEVRRAKEAQMAKESSSIF